MDKKLKKYIESVIVSFLLIITMNPIYGLANELPPGMVIGDENGVNATKNGEYHVNVGDVLPGKQWKTTISMINMEKDIPYKLTMLISPAKVSGSLDLSKAIQMTLTYEGKTVYQGPASGISDKVNLQTTPLELGVFSAGDSRALEVVYSLSGEYTEQDFEKKNVMDNVWTYYAVKTNDPSKPVDPTNPSKPIGRLPSTGEIVQGIIFLCLGLFLVLVLLLMWKKKKDQSSKLVEKEE